MGLSITPKVGTYKCGQNKVGTWRTTWEDAPQVVLNSEPFVHEIYEGPIIKLSVNRAVLYLRPKPFSFSKDTAVTPGRAVLTLKAGVFEIGPFTLVEMNKARLYLIGRLAVLSTSSSPSFGRPLLILRGGEARAGRPGLTPSIPESRPLAPTACEPATLTPAALSSRTLVASAKGTKPLSPSVPQGGDLLDPTDVEIR